MKEIRELILDEDFMDHDSIYRKHNGGIMVIHFDGRVTGDKAREHFTVSDEIEPIDVLQVVNISPGFEVVVWEDGKHVTCIDGTYFF